MQFSKRTKYLLLTLLVILNIAFRIPTMPHEYGVDGLLIHSYANVISSHGFANWVIHPLSVFGMYPYSIPSAVPFLQSGCSQLTGLNMEYTILLTSIIIGLMGMFTSYVMAKEMKNDDLFAFLVAFFFSLSPLFLSLTIWTTSTRHLFIALVPLFIWGLLRCYNSQQGRSKYIFLTVVLFILFGTIHHIVLLLGFVLIAYFMSLIFAYCEIPFISNKKYNSIRLPATLFLWFSACIAFIALQVRKLYFYKEFNIWYKYQSGFFFHGTDAKTLFMNMVVDYWSKIGLLALFGIFGVVCLLKKQKRDFYQNFLVITVLLFAPILTWGWYVPLILLAFFCALLVYGILKLISHKQLHKFACKLLIIGLLLSTVFSISMLWNWNMLMPGQKGNYLQDSDYNLGAFLKVYGVPGSSFVGSREVEISAVSELSLPPPSPYMFDFVNKSDLGINRSFSLSSLLHIDDSDAIYKSKTHYKNEYYSQPANIDSDRRKEYDSKYNINYAVLQPGIRSWDYTFCLSVSEKKPKIYDNDKLSVWYIGRMIRC